MKEKMLMNPVTGTVAPESEWRADFECCSLEEWGSDTFESANLIEVECINDEWVEVG